MGDGAIWRIGSGPACWDSAVTGAAVTASELQMHFDERDEGDYRIRVGAVQVPGGGYSATAVVKRVRGVPEPVEVFRDERLSGGHDWDEPERALRFAMQAAVAIVRERVISTQLDGACTT